MKPSFQQTVSRSIRLSCPQCGKGHVAKSWRETERACSECGFDFSVEGGFYLGSIYLNYGLLAGLGLAFGLPAVWLGYLTPTSAIVSGIMIGVPTSIWFFRYARSLWLGFGYYIDHNVRNGGKSDLSTNEVLERQQTLVEPRHESVPGICYFCHERFAYSESLVGKWTQCPFCDERILLTRISLPPVDDDDLAAQQPGDVEFKPTRSAEPVTLGRDRCSTQAISSAK